MSILEKEVLITLVGHNTKYYENLKYDIPKQKNKQGIFKTRKGTKILVKIKDLQKGSRVALTKVCDDCGKNVINQPYKSILKYREKFGKDRCRECGHKFGTNNRNNNTDNFTSLYEYTINNDKFYLLSEYSNKNEKPPEKIPFSYSKLVLWDCPDCNSEYQMSVANRTYRNDGCHYCSGKKVNHTNCLATINPKLTSEWHPTKNEELTPYDVTNGSGKKVWWICEKGHSWDSTVNTRTSNESGCPYCAGLYPTEENNLEILSPELLKEWNYTKNKKNPYEYLNASSYKVWWICEKGHEWYAKISNRTILRRCCPICSESKGEKIIREWLKENNIDCIPQKTFNNLVGTGGGLLSYDFYLPDYNLLIEYQGEFHDGNGNYYMKQNLEKQKEHDRRKKEYAEQNGIELLEIWYWDFDNIEEILENNNYKFNIISNL